MTKAGKEVGEEPGSSSKGYTQHCMCTPAIPLKGISPRAMKTYVPAKTWALMFVRALFTIAVKTSQMSIHGQMDK